jgi:hypothetical protein
MTADFNQLMSDKAKLDQIMADGAIRARQIATPIMQKVREKVRG